MSTMAIERTPSWVTESTTVQGLSSWADAKERLGIDWDLVRRPRTDPGAEKWSDIVRTDTGEVVHPGATKGFRLVNLDDFGHFVEASLGHTNVEWDTFHVFDGGAAMFSTIRLDEPLTIAGDGSPLYPFMGFSNRVDGKGSLLSFLAMERAWCANMLNSMIGKASRAGGLVKFTHSSRFNMDAAIDATRDMIDRERQMSRNFVAEASRLNSVKVSPEAFVKRWLPHSDDMTLRQHNNVDWKRMRFFTALTSDRSVERPDTAWSVLQAAVDVFQYDFPVKGSQSREKRAMTMITPSMNQQHDLRKAYKIVRSMAK